VRDKEVDTDAISSQKPVESAVGQDFILPPAF